MKVGDLRYVHTQPSEEWSAKIVQVTETETTGTTSHRVRVVTGECNWIVGHPDFHKRVGRDAMGGHIPEASLRKLTKLEYLIAWWKLLWMKSL